MHHLHRWFLIIIVSFLLIIGLLLPITLILKTGCQPSLFYEFVLSSIYLEGLQNACLIAIVTTLLTTFIAFPMAYLFYSVDFYKKQWFHALALTPMVLPPFVGALGIYKIFGREGVINACLQSCLGYEGLIDWFNLGGKFWLVCIVEAFHLYPILYLNLLASFHNLDPSLVLAAKNLGASRWKVFYKITLPLIMPGLFAGVSIVFIWSLTELGTPLMLGFLRVTPVQIFNTINELDSNPLPYVLSLILMGLSISIYCGSKFFLRHTLQIPSTTKGPVSIPSSPPSFWSSSLAILFFSCVIVLAILPHLSVALLAITRDWYGTIFPTSYTLSHFQHALAHNYVVPSILNSIHYSFWAMLLCLFLSFTISLANTRWRIPGHTLFDIAAMAPLAIPGLVMAFGYLALGIRLPSYLKDWFDPFKNPFFFLVLAYAIRRLPYATRTLTAGFQQCPEELELAALSIGATKSKTFLQITLPLIFPHLLIACLFVFSFSMLEVSDSLILAQVPGTFPITRAIYELSFILGEGPYLACAFGLWAMVFLGSVMLTAMVWMGQKIGNLFRF